MVAYGYPVTLSCKLRDMEGCKVAALGGQNHGAIFNRCWYRVDLAL